MALVMRRVFKTETEGEEEVVWEKDGEVLDRYLLEYFERVMV